MYCVLEKVQNGAHINWHCILQHAGKLAIAECYGFCGMQSVKVPFSIALCYTEVQLFSSVRHDNCLLMY